MFYAFVSVVHGAWGGGPVHVAATADGVTAVALEDPPDAFEAGLARRGLVPDRERAGPVAATLARTALAAAQGLLAGEAVDATAIPVDIGDRPAWDRAVLEAVRSIPRGTTASYGEVAQRIGRHGAARAVGGAVGRNPVGLLIPCHRVIAGDGTLGGYGIAAWGGRKGALALKRELLAQEGVRI